MSWQPLMPLVGPTGPAGPTGSTGPVGATGTAKSMPKLLALGLKNGDDNGTNNIFYSNNGVDWTQVMLDTVIPASVAFNGEHWLLGGNNPDGFMFKSDDGINWTLVDVGILNVAKIIAINMSGFDYTSRFWGVIAANTFNLITDATYSYITVGNTPTTVNAIAHDGGNVVVAGGNGLAWWNTYDTSMGFTTGAFYDTSFIVNDIAYGSGMFIAVGTSDVCPIALSPDGQSWDNHSMTIPSQSFNAKSVAFNGQTWIVCGYADVDNIPLIWRSTDGYTWLGPSIPDSFFTSAFADCISVTWVDPYWVLASPSGTILTSIDDGKTWFVNPTDFASLTAVATRKMLPNITETITRIQNNSYGINIYPIIQATNISSNITTRILQSDINSRVIVEHNDNVLNIQNYDNDGNDNYHAVNFIVGTDDSGLRITNGQTSQYYSLFLDGLNRLIAYSSADSSVTQLAPLSIPHSPPYIVRYDTSDTYLFPDGNPVYMHILLVGGGGGGGGGSNTGGGGGGGSGYRIEQTYILPNSGQIVTTIGAGGSGGNYGSDGTDGGATSISLLDGGLNVVLQMTAPGGKGGRTAYNTSYGGNGGDGYGGGGGGFLSSFGNGGTGMGGLVANGVSSNGSGPGTGGWTGNGELPPSLGINLGTVDPPTGSNSSYGGAGGGPNGGNSYYLGNPAFTTSNVSTGQTQTSNSPGYLGGGGAGGYGTYINSAIITSSNGGNGFVEITWYF